MQNNKLQKIFFRTFLITIIVIVMVTVIGLVSYKVIKGLFKDEKKETQTQTVNSLNIITDITLGTPSVELIYDADENDTVIKHMVIGILNTETHNLDYVTVPVNTMINVSDELYSELSKISPSLPQSLKIGDVTNYFSGKEAYEYGELLLEDAIGVKMSYYTKIPTGDFANYFTQESCEYYQPAKGTYDDTLVYSSTLTSKLSATKPENMIGFLTDYSNEIGASNLTLSNRTKYASAYAQVDFSKNYYWHLFGEFTDGGDKFEINVKQTKKLFDSILKNNATYTVTQKENNELLKKSSVSDSKKLKIKILNGSGIRKQAAKWQEKLEADGYKIAEIGDYGEDNLTTSKIITSSETTGLDLVKYFKNAQVEVGTVPEGYNIVIVIGSEDKIEE